MAESSPAHEADDGQINLEFDEEAQEVVLEDDAKQTSEESESVEPETESVDEHEQYGKSVQKRINQLTKRAREAEREREEAVKYAQAIQQENQNVKQRLHNLDKNYIDEYGNRVSSEQQRAKDELKTAIETGDTDRQLAAQEKISQLAVAADRHAQARAQREVQAAQFEQEVQQPVYQPAPQTQRPDPRAEQWAEDNEWFGKDEVMTYAAFGIHKRLVEQEGLDPKSEEYYSSLDSRMREEFPQKFGDNTKSNRVVQTVASANRSTKSGRRTVKLTPSQVAIAKKLGVPLEEYAKHVKEA